LGGFHFGKKQGAVRFWGRKRPQASNPSLPVTECPETKGDEKKSKGLPEEGEREKMGRNRERGGD